MCVQAWGGARSAKEQQWLREAEGGRSVTVLPSLPKKLAPYSAAELRSILGNDLCHPRWRGWGGGGVGRLHSLYPIENWHQVSL